MGKGFDELDKVREETPKRAPSITNRLRISDGDIALIRFLTDAGDVFWHKFHGVKTKSRLGKTYTDLKYCDYLEEGECKYCDSEDESVRIPSTKFFFWVYVRGILHRIQDTEGAWKKIKYLKEDYYKEDVGRVMILETGPGHVGVIENKFRDWAKRFGTLCDRDYEWKRKGKEMTDTSYDLVPLDPSEFKEAEELKKDLMDLEEVAKMRKDDYVSPVATEPEVSDDIVHDIKSIFEPDGEEKPF